MLQQLGTRLAGCYFIEGGQRRPLWKCGIWSSRLKETRELCDNLREEHIWQREQHVQGP